MDFYFLLFSLFFPRVTLFVYYIQEWMPANNVPFIGDFLMSVFIPRILVLIYIYQNMGYENMWFVVHLIVLILTFFGGGNQGRRRYKARKSD